ncbi:MAG: LCP family protein [Lachnospiraceae bacterium]|nr:LCP family protein [Lachnospiraceae bacterium]
MADEFKNLNGTTEVKPASSAKKKKTKYRVILGILIGLLALIVIGLGVGFFVIRHYYNKSDYQEIPSEITIDSSALQSLSESEMAKEETMEPSVAESIQRDIESDIAAARSSLLESLGITETETQSNAAQPSDNQPGENPGQPAPTAAPAPVAVGNVYNVLLVGVDRRQPNWNGNSDSMILISINNDKGKITMTSFMRDTYTNIPGLGWWKMNHAWAVGGAGLCIATVESNFLIHVNNYASVDFNGLTGLIDAIGGVDVMLQPDEAAHIGLPIGGAQVVHLDGTHALRHARNRSTGNSYDYGRTQRQRDILMAIYNKIKSGGLGSVANAANAILPYVTHNIDGGTMASLIASAPSMLNWPITQLRVPFDGMYYSQNQNLVPDFQATIGRLWSVIY